MRKIIGEIGRYYVYNEKLVFIHIEDDMGGRLMLQVSDKNNKIETLIYREIIPIIPWSLIMTFIDEMNFSDKWLVEIYPPKNQVIDNDNVRHFWFIEKPNYGFH